MIGYLYYGLFYIFGYEMAFCRVSVPNRFSKKLHLFMQFADNHIPNSSSTKRSIDLSRINETSTYRRDRQR